jgi:PAS domain S-box-containing protein
MATELLKVLLVDDDEDDFVMTRELLRDVGTDWFKLDWASTYEAAIIILAKQQHDVCLCDYRLGANTGLDLLKEVQGFVNKIPIILLTGQGDHEVDMAAMKAGAADYLVKNQINPQILERSIRYAVEHHRSAEALRDSEIRFRQLSEASHEGIIILESNLVLDVTANACRMFGYEAAEIIGHSPLDFIAPEHKGTAQSRFERGDQHAFETIVMRKDGTRFPVEVVVRPIPFRGRMVWVATLRDISVYKNAESNLRQQLARMGLLNQIARAIAERQDMKSIFQVALDHLEEHLDISLGGVFYYEPGTQKLTLMASGTRSRKTISPTANPEGSEIELSATPLARCLEGQVVCEPDLCKSDLPAIQKLVRAGLRSGVSLPLAADGRTFGILTLLRDKPDAFQQEEVEFLKTLSEQISLAARHAQLHTDLQAAYDKLRQSQQVAVRQERLAAVGQLSAGIAHEFNNILTIIQGYTSILLHRQQGDDATVESLKNILSGAERASRLTAQLLAFSRKQVIQPQPLDLNEVVGNVSKMLSRVVGENIQLNCDFAPTPLTIMADLGMVEQIIMNLAVNSRDAMPQGGGLSIRTRQVEVASTAILQNQEARPGIFACLTVSDTGCGMDTETQEKLFEPFFTTKDVGKGTGLGLASVYGIVKQHQGWIEVTSQLGRGSEFHIYLPLLDVCLDANAAAAASAVVAGGDETILLVEDEPALRMLVRDVLRSYGYQIYEANNGPEALQVWEAHGTKVDLLLTDIVMPGGMSGEDLAKKLLADRPLLKVIYTSGYSVDLAGKNLALQPKVNFLPKPYRPTELARMVRDCLDKPVSPN